MVTMRETEVIRKYGFWTATDWWKTKYGHHVNVPTGNFSFEFIHDK